MAAVPGDVKDCLRGKAGVTRPPKSQGGTAEGVEAGDASSRTVIVPPTWNSHPQGGLAFQVEDQLEKGL